MNNTERELTKKIEGSLGEGEKSETFEEISRRGLDSLRRHAPTMAMYMKSIPEAHLRYEPSPEDLR